MSIEYANYINVIDLNHRDRAYSFDRVMCHSQSSKITTIDRSLDTGIVGFHSSTQLQGELS
jgi:hypothetical protein